MQLPFFLVMTVGLSLTACNKEVSKEQPGEDATSVGKADTALNISSRLIHSQHYVTDDEGIEGRRLAIQHCQRCHVFVEPAAIPKTVWQSYVFPRMGAYIGMHHAGVKTKIDPYRNQAERQIVESAGIYSPRVEMTRNEWQVLMAYFLDHAPDHLEKPAELGPISPRSELFQEENFGYKQENPNTTMVRIDEDSKRVFVGEEATKQLSILDSNLNRIQKITMRSAPVHAQIINDDLWLTNIGFLNPSDVPEGELVVLKEGGGYYSRDGEVKLTQLRRPTHSSYADMNKDGLTDILMSEYGNRLGALTYYQAKKNGTYQKIELMKEPGSMVSHIRDFNNDGWPDVAVINGQGKEGVHILYNRGDGSFTLSYALPLPAHYGSSSIAFYDFNADGYPDILATNGDNGDYPAILKPFHGVRIYLNDGNNGFHQRYFFPMHGAYKALAEDFDLDGDLDIAAISMFADLDERAEEGFVYLENEGGFNFKASTISRVRDGRWMCMDTGDLDGDGDKDIVLGSFMNGPSEVPPSYLESWANGRLPGLVLWNNTNEASPSGGSASEVTVKDDESGQKIDGPRAYFDLGLMRHKQGREAEAIMHLGEAVRLKPDDVEAQHTYGLALYGKGETQEAIKHFQQAVKLQPSYAEARNSLGVALLQQNKLDEAIENFHQALRSDSNLSAARFNLGHSLQTLAKEVLGEPFQIQDGQPDLATMHAALGNALQEQAEIMGAVRHYQWALDINPDLLPALNNLAWIRATDFNKEFRDGAEAVNLAERCCKLTNYQLNGTLDTLAAAYAEVGRFDDAIRWLTKALELADDAGKQELSKQLDSYRAGKPLRK
tara:strand:- start:852 stop:3350 length:2499 start_codon:yes stop_codon:yes gene_type:complete